MLIQPLNETDDTEPMGTWNYETVTAVAEKQIRDLMDGTGNLSPEVTSVRRNWAFGVFIGWYRLTLGWKTDSDFDRLQALARGKGLKKEQRE